MAPISVRIAVAESKVGWHFHEPRWLVEALTHSTYANEHPEAGPPNERLEFVGDAVIDLVAARILFERYTAEPEGELTRRRARVVRMSALADMARELGLAELIRVGEAQRAAKETGSRLLADAFEAVVGAVFMDGGYAAVDQCFAPRLAQAIERASLPLDFKTLLQEECHKKSAPLPSYRIVSVAGPDYARHYTCEVLLGERVLASAAATAKKAAEQECARLALAVLGGK